MTGHALPLTGERTLPGIPHERYWFARHVAAYRFATGYCHDARVLDGGCGEGYGTALLADVADTAIGIDRAEDVIAHAAAAYPRGVFSVGELDDLPLGDATVDVVVSLQVIEHLPDVPAALAETARVLTPDGTFVCATPNRLTFTPGSDTPVNPFHITEFTADELRTALEPWFEPAELLGVHHGDRLTAVEAEVGRSLPDLQQDSEPGRWPGWLAELVASVTPDDFRLSPEHVDRSLDLVVVARRR
jgi:SAM-dependent methyltransferase